MDNMNYNEFDYYSNNNSPKKGTSFLKKAGKTVALGLTFGAVAGFSMFGINYLCNDTIGQTTTSKSVAGNPSSIKTVSLTNTNSSSSVSGITVTDVSGIVDACMPSCVAITGKVTATSFYQRYEAEVAGSGIIIGKNDTELLIVTNAHVVDSVNDLSVVFVNDKTVEAVVKGTKSSKDLAVIAVSLSNIDQETMDSIRIATIGDASLVKEGQAAVAIGNALGYGQSVTSGVVSAKGRTVTIEGTEYSNLIQTDAAINPGNSGGALINAQGEVIGINSCKLAQEDVEGIGYAIPVSEVMDIIEDLMNKETRNVVDESERGYLGIAGKDIGDEYVSLYGYPEGIYVSNVLKDSPAEAAGLKKGDIIVGFDGDTVKQMTTLKTRLKYYKIGETVEVEYYRLEGDKYVLNTTKVTLRADET
ncbi:MAG TPA: serine protease [Eubacterium sp.]|nr:trypsin-like peptidase domain-containing protein [Lachnospiraceae bacterium]HBZ53358.1 serine protease [Eubacterium sp.]